MKDSQVEKCLEHWHWQKEDEKSYLLIQWQQADEFNTIENGLCEDLRS